MRTYENEEDTAQLLNYTVTPNQIIKATFLTFSGQNPVHGMADPRTNDINEPSDITPTIAPEGDKLK